MDIITYPCWALTHRGRVTHICVSKVTRSVPSHYLNQCWNIVNWTLRNKLQWNLNRNSYISIQENAFKIVWKMAIILSRPQCVMLIHACKTGPPTAMSGSMESASRILTYFPEMIYYHHHRNNSDILLKYKGMGRTKVNIYDKNMCCNKTHTLMSCLWHFILKCNLQNIALQQRMGRLVQYTATEIYGKKLHPQERKSDNHYTID